MRKNIRSVAIAAALFTMIAFPRLEAAVDAFSDVSAINVSMDFQNASLKDVLKILSVQSGFNFIASEAVQDRKITLFLDNVPLKEVVDKLFKANNLSYDLYEESNIIVVKDWGKPQADTVTKVFPLKHASVVTSAVRQEMSQVSVTGMNAGAANKEKDTACLTNTIQKLLSAQGSVIEDYRTNSLVVTEVPSRMPLIEKTIALLDVPVSQVLIEVEILDVSKNVVDKMGFEYSQSPFTMVLTGATAPTRFPFPFGKWSNFDSSTGTGTGGSTTSGAGSISLNTSKLDGTSASYQIVMDLLHTQNDVKYLARPKLLTLNNETAEISITRDEVVGKKETTNSTSAGQSTATEYIRSTDLKLTPEGVGIYLRVTPQVNPETGEITMVINPKSSVTSVSPLAATQADAEVRASKSIVKVKDGDTVVVGGLIHTDKEIVSKKVPFLGDIPIMGALFRHKNQSIDLDRELLVFITPHIIKDSNMELVKAGEIALPEREQGTGARGDRRSLINSSLDNIEKWQ
ncbi:MAG TPA: secretin N-terminal domain-containing protein [Patescibacteria group bacterium]|nr:secretin N-terminal domain-containing protein [Patescibacteria group bacterium]